MICDNVEQVPFRLTRDIVDGMGVTGVEGVFRRCCEEALLVMRMNKDALLTIIEVRGFTFYSISIRSFYSVWHFLFYIHQVFV